MENEKVHLIIIFYKQLEWFCVQELQNLILVGILNTELHLIKKKSFYKTIKDTVQIFLEARLTRVIQHTLTCMLTTQTWGTVQLNEWLNRRQEDKQWCSGRDHHPVLQTAHFRFHGRQERTSGRPSPLYGFVHIQKTTVMFRTWTWNLRGAFNGSRRRIT
jgi:hypothetical protein